VFLLQDIFSIFYRPQVLDQLSESTRLEQTLRVLISLLLAGLLLFHLAAPVVGQIGGERCAGLWQEV
jgi:hypothetical protein